MTLAIGMVAGGTALAQDTLTIGTGAAALTYAPVGKIIATSITDAVGLPVVAVPSRGSLDNINGIASGDLVSGFAQSDIGYWAYEGTGIWSGRAAVEELRTIAALYEEHIHVVTRADSGIESIEDLRNKRISIDKVGSGTHVDARLILEAAQLRSDEYAVADLSGEMAAEALVKGEIDAFFMVAGYPTDVLVNLSEVIDIALVPIDGDVSVELLWRHGFLAQSEIPDDVYGTTDGVATVSVGAHWFTRADVPDDLVYATVKALFSDKTQRLLTEGHPKGQEITAETSLDGVAVPLHPGAVRFYEESGVMD